MLGAIPASLVARRSLAPAALAEAESESEDVASEHRALFGDETDRSRFGDETESGGS